MSFVVQKAAAILCRWNSSGESSGPFEEWWEPPICKAESSAKLGFLAALWRVVCNLKDRIPFELFADCSLACIMGSFPSVVEELTREASADFWGSQLAREYVQAMAAATGARDANWLRLRGVCGQQATAAYHTRTRLQKRSASDSKAGGPKGNQVQHLPQHQRKQCLPQHRPRIKKKRLVMALEGAPNTIDPRPEVDRRGKNGSRM